MEDEDGHREPGQEVDGGAGDAAGDSAGGAEALAAARNAALANALARYNSAANYHPGLANYGGGGLLPLPNVGFGVGTYQQTFGGSGYYTPPQGVTHVVVWGAGGPGALGSSYVPPPVEHGGVKLGEIEAWRCWRVAGGLLQSVAMDTVWAPGQAMTAENIEYGGGVHAWKTRMDASRYAQPGMIIGRVALWGEVVEHANGYRAEYGKPIELVYGPDKEQLHSLRLEYGLGDDGWKPQRWGIVLDLRGNKLRHAMLWTAVVNIAIALTNLTFAAFHLWRH